jgi:hypothetical protein
MVESTSCTEVWHRRRACSFRCLLFVVEPDLTCLFSSFLRSELPLGVGPSSLPAPAFVLPTPVRSLVDARVRHLLTELAAQGNLHGIQVSRARRLEGRQGRGLISRAYDHEVELARPASRLVAVGI